MSRLADEVAGTPSAAGLAKLLLSLLLHAL
jgi:hypothetical protein